jgi:hypothetical protein
MTTQFVYDLSCFANIINATEPVTDSRINIINTTTKSNQSYKIINYKKESLTKDPNDVCTYGLLRSVIVSSDGRIVSFAPPKSFDINTINIQDNPNLVAEEFVEGTMINVFWDSNVNEWQIATRRTIGANNSFYLQSDKKTFSDMFFEACAQCKFNFNILNNQFMYSFVLQHPNNRIVCPIKTPQLYLVEVYYINPNAMQVAPILLSDVKSSGMFNNTNIKFPEQYTNYSLTDLVAKFCSESTPFNVMGVLIKDQITGQRVKMRNPVYENVKLLKGNQPKLLYQYLNLRHEGKVSEYLQYYPENKKDFTKFREQIHNLTNNLFCAYVSCYIKKEAPLGTYCGQLKTHMFNIHKIFLETLKPQGLYVTMSVVISYVNGLHPSQLMHTLNYDLHENNANKNTNM